MLTPQQNAELNLLTYDYNQLVNKKGAWTKADDARAANFQVQIANVKAGGSGRTSTPFLSVAQEAEARAFKDLVEKRDMKEGAPMNAQIGSYSDLGFFVKSGFYDQLTASMRQHDRIFFDPNFVTLIQDTNSNPLPLPIASDVSNTLAAVSTEANSQTSTDIDFTNHAVLNGYIYNTRRMVFSVESYQDFTGAFACSNLFKKFMAESFARGLTADLLLGSGVSKPLGLIPALLDQNIVPVIATGDSESTGGAQTGSTSIGVTDIRTMWENLDDAYDNDHTAWLMNRATLGVLSSIIDKYGNIVDLVKWTPDGPKIYGVPVVVSPSMEGVGISQYSVLLGDFSYFATRVTIPSGENVQVYTEAPGLVENGNIALRASLRGDGALLWENSSQSDCPFVLLQHHS